MVCHCKTILGRKLSFSPIKYFLSISNRYCFKSIFVINKLVEQNRITFLSYFWFCHAVNPVSELSLTTLIHSFEKWIKEGKRLVRVMKLWDIMMRHTCQASSELGEPSTGRLTSPEFKNREEFHSLCLAP